MRKMVKQTRPDRGWTVLGMLAQLREYHVPFHSNLSLGPHLLALRHKRFFARGKVGGLGQREPAKRSARGLALIVRCQANLSLIHLKSSRGRRNARPPAMMMKAFSQAAPILEHNLWSFEARFSLLFYGSSFIWSRKKAFVLRINLNEHEELSGLLITQRKNDESKFIMVLFHSPC